MRLLRFIPYALLVGVALGSVGGHRLADRQRARANRAFLAATQGAPNGGMAAAGQMSARVAGQALTNAYVLLANADHDYNGHRVQAMHAVRKAALRLRINLQGHGTGQAQPQGDSDAKLRKAQQILEQVRGSMGGSRRGAAVRQHVNEAIQHITTALQIR
jgi:hypothetical protein